jgi:hypothetical protein
MSKLIDELDSLHELLRHEPLGEVDLANWPLLSPKTDDGEEQDPIPVLEEVVEYAPPASELGEAEIPLLEEVVEDTVALLNDGPETASLPSQTELRDLIETLVDRRLQRIRPAITEQVREELLSIYPGLFPQ